MSTHDQTPVQPPLLLLIALLQGLALLLLHQSLELEFWPYPQLEWLTALYSVALATPTVLLLGLGERGRGAVWIGAGLFGGLLFCLGYYVGLQAGPVEVRGSDTLLFGYGITVAIATFKALMYLQQRASGEPFHYHQLFLLSWRNFLTLGLSLLFALCLWGVLMLWAALFEAIGIGFFERLFREPWFFYPVLALANGFGIVLLRRFTRIIDSLAQVQQALMKLLLVLLVFISLTFLAALPFTGLQPLWDSGGSTLVLWMQALTLFFLNAVYSQGERAMPYPLGLHRFLYLGVALLPVYSAISLYGLWLRVDQYGLTVSRCWGLMIWLLLALFSLGYLLGIVRLRDHWPRVQSRVNVALGLVLLGAMLLVNSPLLDFRKLSLASQLQRLERGDVSPQDFDYSYLRWQLAGPGHRALQSLRQRYADSHPDVALRIDHLYLQPGAVPADRERLLAVVNRDGLELPPALVDAIQRDYEHQAIAAAVTQVRGLLPIDLDEDGDTEYLLGLGYGPMTELWLYHRDATGWHRLALVASGDDARRHTELWERLRRGDYELRPRRWRQVEVGGATLQVR